jgi:hypothetical protein
MLACMVFTGGACIPRPNKAVMCECVEIDEKIEYYRLLAPPDHRPAFA